MILMKFKKSSKIMNKTCKIKTFLATINQWNHGPLFYTLKNQKFKLIFQFVIYLTALISSVNGAFISLNLKTYGLTKINDDHYLSYLGGLYTDKNIYLMHLSSWIIINLNINVFIIIIVIKCHLGTHWRSLQI